MSKEGKAILTAIAIIPTIILTFCFPPAGIGLNSSITTHVEKQNP